MLAGVVSTSNPTPTSTPCWTKIGRETATSYWRWQSMRVVQISLFLTLRGCPHWTPRLPACTKRQAAHIGHASSRLALSQVSGPSMYRRANPFTFSRSMSRGLKRRYSLATTGVETAPGLWWLRLLSPCRRQSLLPIGSRCCLRRITSLRTPMG